MRLKPETAENSHPAKPSQRAAFSCLGARNRTVIPRDVRAWLKIKSGDRLRYRTTGKGVLLDKAPAAGADWIDSIQETFSEWSSPEDAAAYDDL
jgi:antitoxin PrlF